LKFRSPSSDRDIQGDVSNHQPHIAAHLQGTQIHCTKANLAKEQQSPTHGIESFNSGRQNPTHPKKN
jgi:hypothetical protein